MAKTTETKGETKAAKPKKPYEGIVSRSLKGRGKHMTAMIKQGHKPTINEKIDLTEEDRKQLGVTANFVRIKATFE